jgi:hypothetical protein
LAAVVDHTDNIGRYQNSHLILLRFRWCCSCTTHAAHSRLAVESGHQYSCTSGWASVMLVVGCRSCCTFSSDQYQLPQVSRPSVIVNVLPAQHASTESSHGILCQMPGTGWAVYGKPKVLQTTTRPCAFAIRSPSIPLVCLAPFVVCVKLWVSRDNPIQSLQWPLQPISHHRQHSSQPCRLLGGDTQLCTLLLVMLGHEW